MKFKENAVSARRAWIRAAAFVLIAVAGVAILMLAPDLDPNPLAYISPG